MPRKSIIACGLIITVLLGLTVYFGSAPPSPIYLVKITRESVQDLFVFGDEDRAYWLLTKAEKRISEAEKLKSRSMSFLASMQSDAAKKYQTEAMDIITSLKDKVNTNYLTDKYNQNKDRLNNL